jgi:hypothetical protein
LKSLGEKLEDSIKSESSARTVPDTAMLICFLGRSADLVSVQDLEPTLPAMRFMSSAQSPGLIENSTCAVYRQKKSVFGSASVVQQAPHASLSCTRRATSTWSLMTASPHLLVSTAVTERHASSKERVLSRCSISSTLPLHWLR